VLRHGCGRSGERVQHRLLVANLDRYAGVLRGSGFHVWRTIQTFVAVMIAIAMITIVSFTIWSPCRCALLRATNPAGAAADQLPDLRMYKLKNLYIEDTSDGRRLLRFDTTIVNVGAGKFELRGSRLDTSTDMSVTQRIFATAGGYRDRAPTAKMYFASGGHTHWHVRDLEENIGSSASTTPGRRSARGPSTASASATTSGSVPRKSSPTTPCAAMTQTRSSRRDQQLHLGRHPDRG